MTTTYLHTKGFDVADAPKERVVVMSKKTPVRRPGECGCGEF